MNIIQIQKKDSKKVYVILDNNYKLILSKEIVYQNQLRKSDQLNQEMISSLLQQEQSYNIKLKALSFLKNRVHSKNELFQKLKRHFSDPVLIDSCLNDLEKQGLIDDKHFAEIFIQEKIRKKKYSKAKLQYELYLKGIDKEIIAGCMKKFFTDNLEEETIYHLVEKKIKILKFKTDNKKNIYQKLLNYLLSKGYDYHLSSSVINKILKVE